MGEHGAHPVDGGEVRPVRTRPQHEQVRPFLDQRRDHQRRVGVIGRETVAEKRQELRDLPGEFRHRVGHRAAAQDVLTVGTPATYPVSLTASVQLAFDRLAEESPVALDLLTLAARLAPEPIPLILFTAHPDQLPASLATAVRDPVAFTAVIRLLRKHALAHVEPGTLQLHPLLAAILRTQPHEDDLAWLLNNAARYLQTRGNLAPPGPLFERALDLRRSRLGDDHPDTLRAATNLAVALRASTRTTRPWPGCGGWGFL
jgi:hypothetical protein